MGEHRYGGLKEKGKGVNGIPLDHNCLKSQKTSLNTLRKVAEKKTR